VRVRAFREILRPFAARLELPLTAEALERLEIHFELLRRWAPKVNLTTVLEPEAAASLHYADSLTFSWVDDCEAGIVDVGSGAGFPGIVIAAATGRPVALLEPLRKRTSFLRLATAEMGLAAVRVIQGRLDVPDRTGLFPRSDVIVSRATFPAETWLDRAPTALGPGGRLVLSAGRGSADRATLEARGARSGLRIRTRRTVELPGGHHRVLDCWVRADDAEPSDAD